MLKRLSRADCIPADVIDRLCLARYLVSCAGTAAIGQENDESPAINACLGLAADMITSAMDDLAVARIATKREADHA